MKNTIKRIWEKEHTPMLLAIALTVGVYFLVTSKLVEYIVAGT